MNNTSSPKESKMTFLVKLLYFYEHANIEFANILYLCIKIKTSGLWNK